MGSKAGTTGGLLEGHQTIIRGIWTTRGYSWLEVWKPNMFTSLLVLVTSRCIEKLFFYTDITRPSVTSYPVTYDNYWQYTFVYLVYQCLPFFC